jgi:predicted sugar kinase
MQNFASVTELLQAFSNLSATERLTLRLSAARRISRTHYTEPDDLIHEALDRCLSGGRHWPTEVNLVVFLSNVMKSIVSTERCSLLAKNSVWIDDWHEVDPFAEMGLVHPSAEERYIELEQINEIEKRWRRLREALSNDEEARAVFQCQLEGLKASAIMQQHSFSPDVYGVAKRRLQRKIEQSGRPRQPDDLRQFSAVVKLQPKNLTIEFTNDNDI